MFRVNTCWTSHIPKASDKFRPNPTRKYRLRYKKPAKVCMRRLFLLIGTLISVTDILVIKPTTYNLGYNTRLPTICWHLQCPSPFFLYTLKIPPFCNLYNVISSAFYTNSVIYFSPSSKLRLTISEFLRTFHFHRKIYKVQKKI